ncbi:hypothetical protein KIW84_075377 [Lathyrus oleraceus]|uniref:Uncharacterized protein n=1 Tax=Pisum sativum TaxID=3888 RepID=A0A9D4VUP2_PEA|nr:hypothetical protein KIW84_075377 [Pisum sativum]
MHIPIREEVHEEQDEDDHEGQDEEDYEEHDDPILEVSVAHLNEFQMIDGRYYIWPSGKSRGWEEQNVCPNWIGNKVFDDILVYWDLAGFKAKSKIVKKMRASEKGAALMQLTVLVSSNMLDAW